MLRSEHQLSVDEFMRLAKQDLPQKPTLPAENVLKLRAKLILEECLETIAALGFRVEDGLLVSSGPPNLVEIVDGCCDIAVVTTGTLSACGIPDLPFQRAVNENNLAKFGPGHSIREDGKLIKPPGHRPPDIRKLLKEI